MAGEQIQEIKAKIDIVNLVSRYLELKKAGKNYKGLCPFHSEKTPSFMVSPELQIFKCFGCGRGGDHFTFLQEIEGIEFREALETLAAQAGVKLERRRPSPEEEKRQEIIKINELAREYFSYLLNEHPVGRAAREYLKRRGIREETIQAFGLGYAPNSWRSLSQFLLARKYPLTTIVASGLVKLRPRDQTPYDFFRGRIMFPFYGHGQRVIGFAGRSLGTAEPKYINIGETPAFSKSNFLYGLVQAKSAIQKEKKAIVVEGPFDVISPFQAGTQNVVGSQGTALTPGQIKLLRRFAKAVVLCYDTDRAGDAAAHRAVQLAEERGLNVEVMTLPEEFKDADELAQNDPARWRETVAAAVPVYDFYFISAFKRHDTTTPVGKKEAARELLPLIKAIPDEIEREDYLKKLAADLEVELGVVRRALEKAEVEEQTEAHPETLSLPTESRLEEYLLALLIKAPLSLAQTALYKLGKHDFAQETTRGLFEKLKAYLLGRKRRLDIKVFGAKIEGEEKKLLGDLYLWDLGAVTATETELEKELEKAFKSLKERSLKRRLRELSQKIREAELTNDTTALESAREEFARLSQMLANL